MQLSIAERWAAKVRVADHCEPHMDTPCWEWTGATAGGYGQMKVGPKNMKTHRVSWLLNVGPIPDEKQLLHACDNRKCCAPHHLSPGTNAENVADKVAKGRQTRLPGDRNGRAKLTTERVDSLRAEMMAGRSKRSLAKESGVSRKQLLRIERHEQWVAA